MIYRRKKRLLCLLIIFCITLVNMFAFNEASAYTSRIYGMDRYKTAIEISKKGWTSSTYAVLARGDDFPDALCAGPLAKMNNAPILLTEPWRLNPDVLTELKRLGVSHVYIIGGTGAVSWTAENALRNAGISTVERIYGSDRYETSVKIAEKLGWPGKVVLATGENYPDALSISAIAAKKGIPILLTGKDSLPYNVKQYIQSKSISQTYIVGGTGVISEWVRLNVPGAVRLGGNDRYETNVAILQYFANELDYSNVYVAVGDGPGGDEFADALTGAVLASKTSSPLILTGSTLPATTANYIRTKLSPISKITALGGEGVVPSSVVNTIENYVSGSLTNVSVTYNIRGTYGPYQGTNSLSGNVLINADGVTLQNTIINGNLILGAGIGSGTVYLRNVTVTGTTTVKGGGPNSIYMYDFDSQYVVVDVPALNNVRLFAQGNTDINHVTMRSDGRLEESGLTATGFNTVVVEQDADVYMYGSFGTVSLTSSNSSVNLESGSISTLIVETSSSGSRITLSSGAHVDSLTLDAKASVYGSGQINRANINAEDSYLQMRPSNTFVRYGIRAYINGQYITGNNYNYDYSYNYYNTVRLYKIRDSVTINADESYYAYTNINNYDGATLTYYSSNSNVTVDSYTGLIYSSVPGASAVITVYGTKPGYNTGVVSFEVYISTPAPVVTGVENNKTYDHAVYANWTDPPNTTTSATYSKDGGPAVSYTRNTAITEDGNYVLVVKAVSTINGYSASTAVNFKIDKVPPEKPVVTGVTDGGKYFSAVSATWQDVAGVTITATIKKDNNEPISYNKGAEIKDTGQYVLTVTAKKDANGLTAKTIIDFEIDNIPPDAPIIKDVEEGKVYTTDVTPSWDDAVGTTSTVILLKNNVEVKGYSRGTPIRDNGEYKLTVTATKIDNGLKAETTVNFTIDKDPPAAPKIDGVENGEEYTVAVTPTWTDVEGTISTATLKKDKEATKAYNKGTTISENGNYVLVVTVRKESNGLTEVTEISFTINIP